ncbi:MAG: hypothetical protein JO285_00060 [Kutzneria sp.]|nr:hypothetical protein [Kutzneria sp.]
MRIVVIARRSPVRSSYKARSDSRYWSSDARVIAPAQREEDTAVNAFFRDARRVSLAATCPRRMRAARSARACRPRCRPTSVRTFSSALVSRSRSRIRAPAGAATVNGTARLRRCFCFFR